MAYRMYLTLAVAILGIFLNEGNKNAASAAALPVGGEMRSALKFLQDLDHYYAQIARPR